MVNVSACLLAGIHSELVCPINKRGWRCNKIGNYDSIGRNKK